MKLINVIGASLVLTAFVGRAMEPNNSVNEQLFDAVKNGNCALVKHLLNLEEQSSGDLRLNRCNEKHRTLLYVAAKSGHLDLVQLLLDKGANSNGAETGEKDGEDDDSQMYKYKHLTPLHAAAKKGHVAIVKLLIDRGAHVNALAKNNWCSPINLAVENEHIPVVRILLKHGAQMEICDYESYSPLARAVQIGNKALIQMLLKNGAEINNKYEDDSCIPPLNAAVTEGNLDIIRLLLDEGANVDGWSFEGCDEFRWTALHEAVKNEHVNVVQLLLKEGANVNSGNEDDGYEATCTPLHVAAGLGATKVVKLLLRYGANRVAQNSDKKTPLYVAFENNHLDVVDLLINYRSDFIDCEQLYGAALHGNVKLIQFLLDKGVDVNSKDSSNKTALHAAAQSGHLAAAQLLVKNGALVDAKTTENYTPLHSAMEDSDVDSCLGGKERQIIEGKTQVIKFLLAQEADVNAQTNNNKTPLYLFVKNSSYYPDGHCAQVVKLLLDSGAYSNTQSGNKTLLHYAAANNQPGVIKLLIAHGLDVNAQDSEGKTPVICAGLRSSKLAIKALLDNGATINCKANNGSTLLHLLADTHHANLIELLIAQGLDANALDSEGNTPLHCAVTSNRGSYDKCHLVVKALLSKGAHITPIPRNQRTLLHMAAMNRNVALIKLLIAQGLEVNAQDSEGNTPLCLAVRHQNQVNVEALLSYEASIRPDLLSNRTLQKAQTNRLNLSQAKEFKTIAQLLNKRAYAYPLIEKQVNDKRQELFQAIKSNNVGLVAHLLKQGFTLSTCDKEGNTLLHKAIESKSLQVVTLLLSLGAHKYIGKANKHGFTPMDLLVSKQLVGILHPLISNSQAHHEVGLKRKR
ncbi:ankyrin repeat domain-containing protein [Candidatus Dependentiae bacterium]|nr:ankyrin repeat domain-containing protein [Candidatus Dependentiae bacterium]